MGRLGQQGEPLPSPASGSQSQADMAGRAAGDPGPCPFSCSGAGPSPTPLPGIGLVWLRPTVPAPGSQDWDGALGLTGELSGDQARKSHSKPWAFLESRR